MLVVCLIWRPHLSLSIFQQHWICCNCEFNPDESRSEPKGIQSNVNVNSGQKGLPCHFTIMWNWVQKTYHCHCCFEWKCVQTDSISEKSLSRKIEFHTTGIPGGWWSYQWENKSCTLSDNKRPQMLKRWDRQKLSQISKKLSHLVHVVTSKDFHNFPSGNKVATCNSQWLDLTIVCVFHGTGNLDFYSETISCFSWHKWPRKYTSVPICVNVSYMNINIGWDRRMLDVA